MWKRMALMVLGCLVVAVGGGYAYLSIRKPAMRPAPSLKVASTPEAIERGRYLFQSVLDCDGCHSERDFGRFGGPVVRRAAGTAFPPEMGLPGTVIAPNISSDNETGIGNWTDGEVLRAIREGVSRDGRALFPMMPYGGYRNLSDEDAFALVAYIRTIPPVRNALPRTQLAFPVNLLIKSAPAPVESVQPAPTEKLARGAYLVSVAGCRECHTKAERGQPIKGMEFAGGEKFQIGTAVVYSANITPDTQTGLGKMSEDQFVEKVFQYKDYVKNGAPKVGDDSFTLMPWLGYSQMTEDDVRAIFAYLRTVKPVVHSVDTHPNAGH